MGDCWEIKDKIGEKKNSGGQKFSGGDFLGKCQKRGWKNFLAVPKSGGNFFGGHNNFLGGEFFRKNLKKKNPRGDSLENCPNKFRGDFLGGGVYRGTCVGGMLGNKRQDRGKKNFRGPEIWGGERLGEMQKKGWNNFWGECCGTCEPQQILGGNFWKNVKEKNLGGKFGGVVRRGRAIR